MKTQEHRSSPLKSHMQSDVRPQSQMKGLQFRSIAPKAPAVVPSSAVLSCQPPSALPEASTAVSPKSILVPAQNYALMQVAGQEGTFSLVALPQTQQQQPIQKNLKLPIPRYQPVRSKSAPEKANSKSPAKVSVPARTQLSSVKTEQSPDPPSEQLVLIDAATSSEVCVAPLIPSSQTDQQVEQKSDASPLNNLRYPSRASKTTLVASVNNLSPVKTPIEGPVSSGSAITVLSPTIFSKAVQIIPSPPKGKLPILPYAKVKNSLLAPTSLANTPTSEQTVSRAKNRLKSTPENKAKTRDSQDSKNTQLKKPPGKKRGRKRKTIEDVLAFEARKRRSLSFFRRRGPEKPLVAVLSSASQEKLLDISKKYRSIRPKPVLVMETSISQLVRLPCLSTSEKPDQEILLGQQIAGKPPGAPSDLPVVDGEGGAVYTGSRSLHRCPTCSRCFQFKHHLQSHMNSHSNLRPYVCPVCRKAYAHSGSLSTHMKLHHAESKPRKSLCCEFCEKSFGYVGVYFSHLREVHRVILTVEPSISQHEDNMPMEESSEADQQSSERVDPVELQIKCGRCQAITPTFADMKLHLLYVHGEEVRRRDGSIRGGREAEDELVKHAAHYWRQLNEKRNLVHCGTCDEEFSFSKFKRHLNSHHHGAKESQEEVGKEEHALRGLSKGVRLRVGSQFNCILCSKVFNKKQDVMEHWRAQHNCENPQVLWDVLDLKGENMSIDGPNE